MNEFQFNLPEPPVDRRTALTGLPSVEIAIVVTLTRLGCFKAISSRNSKIYYNNEIIFCNAIIL